MTVLVRVAPEEIDKSLGTHHGAQWGDKFGYAAGLGLAITFATPATWVDLWPYANLRTPPSGSFTPFMASDDAADQGIEITWIYLNADGLEKEVVVSTDGTAGTTPVSLGVIATDVARGFVTGATDLAGNVTCLVENDFTDGVPDDVVDVLAYIPAVDNQTQQIMGRVPSNKRFLLRSLSLQIARDSGAAGSVRAVLQSRVTGQVFRTLDALEVISESVRDLRGIVLEAGTDYRVRIRDISDNGSNVAGRLRFLTIDAAA